MYTWDGDDATLTDGRRQTLLLDSSYTAPSQNACARCHEAIRGREWPLGLTDDDAIEDMRVWISQMESQQGLRRGTRPALESWFAPGMARDRTGSRPHQALASAVSSTQPWASR